MNWLCVQQPLVQNSSPYLYNVNHNIISLLWGSHEDLWSSGALNDNSYYKFGKMKNRKYRETVNHPRSDDIFKSQLYMSNSALLTSKSDTFCYNYFYTALPRITHWDHIPWVMVGWMVISLSDECPSFSYHVQPDLPAVHTSQNTFINHNMLAHWEIQSLNYHNHKY